MGKPVFALLLLLCANSFAADQRRAPNSPFCPELLDLNSASAVSVPQPTAFPGDLETAIKTFDINAPYENHAALARKLRDFLIQKLGVSAVVRPHPLNDNPNYSPKTAQVWVLPSSQPHRLSQLSNTLFNYRSEIAFDTLDAPSTYRRASYWNSLRLVGAPWVEPIKTRFDLGTIHEIIHLATDLHEEYKDHELAELRLETRKLIRGDQFHFEAKGWEGTYTFLREVGDEFVFRVNGEKDELALRKHHFWDAVEYDLGHHFPLRPLVDLDYVPPRISFFVGDGPLATRIRKAFAKYHLEEVYLGKLTSTSDGRREFRFDEMTATLAEYLEGLKRWRDPNCPASDKPTLEDLRHSYNILRTYIHSVRLLVFQTNQTLKAGSTVYEQAFDDVDRIIPLRDGDSPNPSAMGFSSVHIKLKTHIIRDDSYSPKYVTAYILRPTLNYTARIARILDATRQEIFPRFSSFP